MFEEVKLQIVLNVCKAYHKITGTELRATFEALYDDAVTIIIEESSIANEVLVTLSEENFGTSHEMSVPWFELQNNSLKTLETLIKSFESKKEEKRVELVYGVKKLLYMRFEADPDKNEFDPDVKLKYGELEIDFVADEGISTVLVLDSTGEVLNMKLVTNTVTPNIILDRVLPIIEAYISIY